MTHARKRVYFALGIEHNHGDRHVVQMQLVNQPVTGLPREIP